MILLHPQPAPHHNCPTCNIPLRTHGWYMPGIRVLAELTCERCGREFYGDLPVAHALMYPMLLDKQSGNVYDRDNVEWFADLLRVSYRQRTAEALPVEIETFRPLRNVLLLNCLDVLYGHSLLKLLNAQYYLDRQSDHDLLVIVPRFLRWMVPDGVAEIWTIDLPLRRGHEWNDWLATKLHARLSEFDQAWVSVAYAHPHSAHIDIERFTRIAPFNTASWQAKVAQPVITFIWRGDRRWEGDGGASLRSKVERRLWRWLPQKVGEKFQQRKVTRLAEILRRHNPHLTFAIAGSGEPQGFPAWIKDLRTPKIDQATERAWCQQYAASHIVIGVHGSNMLLPSAHAAIMFNLTPINRRGNAIQDVLVMEEDARMALFRYQLIPLSTDVAEVAAILQNMLDRFHLARRSMERNRVAHSSESLPTLS